MRTNPLIQTNSNKKTFQGKSRETWEKCRRDPTKRKRRIKRPTRKWLRTQQPGRRFRLISRRLPAVPATAKSAHRVTSPLCKTLCQRNCMKQDHWWRQSPNIQTSMGQATGWNKRHRTTWHKVTAQKPANASRFDVLADKLIWNDAFSVSWQKWRAAVNT